MTEQLQAELAKMTQSRDSWKMAAEECKKAWDRAGERAVRNENRSANLVFSAAKSEKRKDKIKALKAKIKRLQQRKSKE